MSCLYWNLDFKTNKPYFQSFAITCDNILRSPYKIFKYHTITITHLWF